MKCKECGVEQNTLMVIEEKEYWGDICSKCFNEIWKDIKLQRDIRKNKW